MWYSILAIASLALILLTAVTFLNLGLKLAKTGAQPVRLIPKIKRKVKMSPEQEEYLANMKKIEEYFGYESSQGGK